MPSPTSRVAQPTSTPQLENQKLEAMRKLADAMSGEIRTLTQAIRVNIRGNPDWTRVAAQISSIKDKGRLTGDLTANAEAFKKKLQSRFGLKNPSEATEGFCKTVLPRLLVWQKTARQLLKK